MNEELQHAELTTVISNYAKKRDWGLFEFECENLAFALQKLGYRNTSDSEAELQELNIKYYNEAKDLRRKLADTESENKRLSEKLGQILLSIDTVKEMNAMCNIDEQRKQTVKEFAEKLQKELPCRDYTYNGNTYSMILTSSMKYVIDKLLKEYE